MISRLNLGSDLRPVKSGSSEALCPEPSGEGPLQEFKGSVHGPGRGRCFRRPGSDAGGRIECFPGPRLAVEAPVDIARGAVPVALAGQHARRGTPGLDERRGRFQGMVEEAEGIVEFTAPIASIALP